MKNLIIVDDEQDTIKKLCKLINFKKLGYDLCAVLPDGEDAIEYLKNNHVDVVVTDIVMTYVSGLELCKHIKESYPHVLTIIMSGYDDFKYAQSALEFGVFRYVLKPISLDEFSKTLAEAHEEASKKATPLSNSMAPEILSLMKKQVYIEFLSGNITPDEFEKSLSIYNSNPEKLLSSAGVLAEIEMLNFDSFITNSWKYNHDSFNQALDNLINMYDNVSAVLTSIDNNRFEIILFHSKEQSPDIVLDRFIRVFKEMTNIDAKILLKESFLEFSHLAGYYLSDHKTSSRIIYQRLTRLANSLSGYVLSGDSKAAKTCLNNIFLLLHSLSLNEAKYISLEIFEPYNKQTENITQTIYKAQSVDILTVAISKMMEAHFDTDRASYQHRIISEAKDYIIKHSSEDITLEMVADHVHLNRIYFSRLFKQTTGENYSDYLLNIRMSEATKLLKSTNMKIHEISVKVGYKNVKYFSEIFKKHIGVLPTEYKSMLKN